MTDFRLHTFIHVCREKSFTRAAEVLCITQPAVSQHIKYLEEDLGQRLLDIQGRSITPTAEGELLLRFAEKAEADALRTRERIASISQVPHLRFGATRTIGEFVMPENLLAWFTEFPETKISMKVDNSDVLFESLHSGALDFIFVEGIFDRDSYSTDCLFQDSLVPVCASFHALADTPIQFRSLLQNTLIIRESGSGSRRLIEQAFSAHNTETASFAHVLEIGNIGAIKELVASGAGIAFLYESSVSQECSSGVLAKIPVSDFALIHAFSFVCLQDSLYESDYRLFLDFCQKQRAMRMQA